VSLFPSSAASSIASPFKYLIQILAPPQKQCFNAPPC
jgi:hypothetical protein